MSWRIRQPASQSPARQSGTALVIALFVMALVVTISVSMMLRLHTDTRRTTLVLNDLQAKLYADGSVIWAMDTLKNNLKNKKPDKLVDILPLASPINSVGGFHIHSTIMDAQDKLNLNNLADPLYQPIFLRLLKYVAPKLSAQDARALTKGIVEWMTPGIINSPYDAWYRKLKTRSPHQPMASVSELRMIRGMTPALFAAISPLVTALPEKTPLNLNTIPLPLLMSLAADIPVATAKNLINTRKQKPFTSPEALAQIPVVKNSLIAQNNGLTVVSQYFLVRTDVVMEEQHLVLYTLLKREPGEHGPTVRIIWQSRGTT